MRRQSHSNQSARERAIELLARREHSRKELLFKLLHKGFEKTEIESALDLLEQKNWLNDRRFAEVWLRHRQNSGHGSYRIKTELSEKGIDPGIIEQVFQEADVNWAEIALQVWQKKYNNLPLDWPEKSKQMRFLQYRGFSGDDIQTMYQMIHAQQEPL